MNCKDCVFSTRRIIVNEYVDWCSHNKSQKEITKETMTCESFIQRNKSKESQSEDASTSSKQSPPTTTNSLPSPKPHKELPIEDRRQLAYQAEEAMQRLLLRDDIRSDMEMIFQFLQPIVDNEREKEFKSKYHISTTYKNFVPVKEVSKTINALHNAIHYHKLAEEDVQKYHRIQQDILHALELTDISEEEMVQYMKDLRMVRLYRRQAKNFLETLEPLYQYALNHREVIDGLRSASSKIDCVTKSIQERKYYVREEKELITAFDNAEPLHIRLNEAMKA